MMSEEFHEIVLNMRVVESVEDFEVLADDRELRVCFVICVAETRNRG